MSTNNLGPSDFAVTPDSGDVRMTAEVFARLVWGRQLDLLELDRLTDVLASAREIRRAARLDLPSNVIPLRRRGVTAS